VRSAVLLALLALAARADDPFAGLRRGDRVRLVTDRRAAFDGVVRSVVDGRLRLEVLLEDGSAFGSVTFEAKEIRSVERGGSEPEALARRPEPAPVPERPPVEPDPPAIPAPPPTAEQLLERFPESDWSAARRVEIDAKDEWLRDAAERAFLRHFEAWSAALAAKKAAEWDARFPVEEGWTEDRREALKRKFVVLGVALTPEEEEFVRGIGR
jgi:hypothetical protein